MLKLSLENLQSIGKTLLNSGLFYIGWFVSVNSAAKGQPFLSVSFAIFVILIHFLFSTTRKKDFLLLISLLFFGFCLDTGYVLLGVLVFQSENPIFPWTAPFWVLGLHGMFATTIDHCLSWLKNSYFLAAIFGALGGMSSYLAGKKMGAVIFSMGDYTSLFIIGFVWFFYTPAVFAYSEWLDKIRIKSS